MKKKIIMSTAAVTLFSTLAFPLSSVLANDLEGIKKVRYPYLRKK